MSLSGCQTSVNGSSDHGSGAGTVTQTTGSSGDWYDIYFTEPANTKSQSFRGGPDQHLADAIRNARAGVDIAVQQLNLWSIRDALINAHRRGVRVRMVTESDYLDESEVQQLKEAGIPVIGDRRQGLMHNKFVIIDQYEVWTGSMNFTVSEGYRNNNALIRIRSPELAQNYLNEFEEMFIDDNFGPGSPANTPYPRLAIGQAQIETCFSPDDGCTARLKEVIHASQESIAFLAFSFTSDDLAEALLDRSEKGVVVNGVMEASQVSSNRGTDMDRFLAAGLDVRLDGNPDQMHHKVMIIDGKFIAVGSFNYTHSAEYYNDENLLIIEDSNIADIFQAEFQRLYHQAVK